MPDSAAPVNRIGHKAPNSVTAPFGDGPITTTSAPAGKQSQPTVLPNGFVGYETIGKFLIRLHRQHAKSSAAKP
jgi:hypothetical protein